MTQKQFEDRGRAPLPELVAAFGGLRLVAGSGRRCEGAGGGLAFTLQRP